MSTDANEPIKTEIKKRNRYYGLLIVVVIALPMVVAYIMFTTGLGIPSGTTNKGELLVPPQPIQELVLNDQEDSLKTLYLSDTKKWRMLVPVTKSCNETCQNHLYISRQVHIRLAEKAYRVERILLLLDTFSDAELERLKQEHPSTIVANSDASSLSNWLQGAKLPSAPIDYFYLVDQEGFAMMRYDSEHTGQDLLDDVKKLLKFTYDK